LECFISAQCGVKEFGRGTRNALDSDKEDDGNDENENQVDIIHYEGDIKHHAVSLQQESEVEEVTPN